MKYVTIIVIDIAVVQYYNKITFGKVGSDCMSKQKYFFTNTSGITTSNNQRPHIVFPHIKWLSESLKNAYSKHGVQYVLLRRQDHQKSPSGSLGQRSDQQEEWSNLQI